MIRRKRIVCGILLAVVVGIGSVAVWQWNNISAALSFFRYSQEELEDKLAQNDQVIKDAVATIPEVTIRDVTQEEKDALRDGTLTQEQLVENLLQGSQKPEQGPGSSAGKEEEKDTTVHKPDDSGSATQKPGKKPEEKPAKPTYEEQVSAIIAEVYVLREKFLIKLDQLKEEALAAYRAIPKEERSTAVIAKLVSSYLDRGLAMEKECDAQIEAIIIRLDTVIRENNGDPSLAQTVYDTYVEEKSLKKAWYMSELQKKGMI